MLGLLRALARDDRGATAIEYGLIVSLIFIAIVAAVTATANSTIAMWTNIALKMAAT
jgi:pilus assembly protein Flp/PilA